MIVDGCEYVEEIRGRPVSASIIQRGRHGCYNFFMKSANLTIGILAHVDAGKTTLSESLLYTAGAIRTHGRVDHQDAFLDTDAMEKKRGITIFSKMARFTLQTQESHSSDKQFILLDTPGHADFSPEMERTLRVLDYAILVVSAPDGVTQQVRVLWKLLSHYHVPTFVFINKIDLTPDRKDAVIAELTQEFGDGFVSMPEGLSEENEEDIAVLSDDLAEKVLMGDHLTQAEIKSLIHERKLFPVCCGAALLDQGTSNLLALLNTYTEEKHYPDAFGGIVYKITREGGQRLTWMKVTGGLVKLRDEIVNGMDVEDSDEENTGAGEKREAQKLSDIRRYNGEKFDKVTEALAGDIVAVAGLTHTRAGDGLGISETEREEMLSPILTVRVTGLPDSEGNPPDDFTLLSALRGIEEQEPMLHVVQDERTKDITVQIMGQVQVEILKNLLAERYGIQASFGQSRIVYKETIRRPVEGVGHFEPLRHYAEVHLLLEPLPTGSGLVFENHCLPNMLDTNWQNLIMTHLQEKAFRGVLTGSRITDLRISLLGGKAHIKHTMGGDFRQATYRAVRQALMMAENILLEPVLSYRLEVPQENLGRAMTDMNAMGGTTNPPDFEGELAVMTGVVPASAFGEYAQTLVAYTAGRGSIQTSLSDYLPCHNARQVIDEAAYDPDLDRWNPSYSVFCSHGAGTPVMWDHVRHYMQVETGWEPAPLLEDGQAHDGPLENGAYLTDDYYTFTPDGVENEVLVDLNQAESAADSQGSAHAVRKAVESGDFATREAAFAAEDKELKSIFESTYGTSYRPHKEKLRNPENDKYYDLNGNEIPQLEPEAKPDSVPGGDPKYAKNKKDDVMREYLLVDGYNIIFAWTELRDLAMTDIKAARDRLMDILANYAGYARENVILVFDAYKVVGGLGEVSKYHGIDVVFTKEAETADLYIEKTAHELGKRHRVTVATSDAVEQVIIFGGGALRLSARGLLERILAAEDEMRDRFTIR